MPWTTLKTERQYRVPVRSWLNAVRRMLDIEQKMRTQTLRATARVFCQPGAEWPELVLTDEGQYRIINPTQSDIGVQDPRVIEVDPPIPLWKQVCAPFCWSYVGRCGTYGYWENRITGKRTCKWITNQGTTSVNRQWLTGGEWDERYYPREEV